MISAYLNQVTLKRTIALALLLSIIPFLVLTFFIHPAYDDFCFAAKTLQLGAWEAWKDTYNTWSGKYFGNVFYALNPLVYESFAIYKAVAFLIILLTFISIFCLVDALLKSDFRLVDKLIAAGFLTALFSNHMPNVAEGYYWMGANVFYQLGVILSLFFFALVIRSPGHSKASRGFFVLLNCILIIAIVGSSETTMLVFSVIIFMITIKAFIEGSAGRWKWLIFSVITIICAIVVLSSPGNAIRSSHFPGRQRFFFSLGMSLAQEARFLLSWFSNLTFILGTILFIPIADKLSDKSDLLKHFRIHPIILTLLLLAIVFLGFFPAYWSTGLLGQHRTVNNAYFSFLIGWFINILVWVNYLKEKRWLKTMKLPAYVYVICIPLLILNLYSTNNTRGAISDLVSGRAYRYDAEVKKRYAQLDQCAREGRISNCPTLKITDLPKTITNPYFELVLGCHEEFWKAKAAALDAE